MIRVFFGGGDPSVVTLPDEKIIDTILAELKDIFGITASPLNYTVFCWPETFPQAHVGHLKLVDEIEAIASARSCLPAQIALAWVLGRGEHVMTIPGTTKLENLKANLGAYDIELRSDEQAALDALADKVKGDRYDEQGMAIIDA